MLFVSAGLLGWPAALSPSDEQAKLRSVLKQPAAGGAWWRSAGDNPRKRRSGHKTHNLIEMS